MQVKRENIYEILERMAAHDKDLRYMAANDLMTGLMNRVYMLTEGDIESKTVRCLLKLIDDKIAEVQNIAVKCLEVAAPLLSGREFNFLASNIVRMCFLKSGEISRMALKMIVSSLVSKAPADRAELINKQKKVKDLYPIVTRALGDCVHLQSQEIAVDLIIAMGDMLGRYGNALNDYHERAIQIFVAWMANGQAMTRKSVTVALGKLAACCTNAHFHTIMSYIILWLGSKFSEAKVRHYTSAANAVCQVRAHLFSKDLEEVIKRLIAICTYTENEDNREAALSTLVNIVSYCSEEAEKYEDTIQAILLRFIAYNPNYCDNGSDEEMPSQSSNEYDEDEQYSDEDDDWSWKIRKPCAVGLKENIMHLKNCESKLANWVETVVPILVDRLKDNEDCVLAEILGALKEVTIKVNKFLTGEEFKNLDSFGDILDNCEYSSAQLKVRNLFEDLHPKLIRNITRILNNKKTNTRNAVFDLLSELTKALPNKLDAEFFYNAIKSGFEEKNASTSKANNLAFVMTAFKTNEPDIFFKFVPEITELLIKAVDDHFYMFVSESISAIAQFSYVLKRAREFDGTKVREVTSIYALLEKLFNRDNLEQEVRIRAITATGICLSILGDGTTPKEANLLLFLVNLAGRAGPDHQRIVAALRAVKSASENEKIKLIFNAQIEKILEYIANMVGDNGIAAASKKYDSTAVIQNAILELLEKILTIHKVNADNKNLKHIVAALPTLLRDTNLQVSYKALICMKKVIEMGIYEETFAAAINKLLESHLLTGETLSIAINVNTNLAKLLMERGKSYKEVLEGLTNSVYSRKDLPKHAFKSFAMATAGVAAIIDNKEGILKLASQVISNIGGSSNIRLFSILTIGELGRSIPEIYNESSLKPEKFLLQILSNPTDEYRPDAAQALGALAAGNSAKFLPFILSNLEENTTYSLPLLNSLKEVLNTSLKTTNVEHIWKILIKHADVVEESTRSVIADCIGKLCNDRLIRVEEALENLLSSKHINVLYTGLAVFKVIAYDGCNIKNKELSPFLESIERAVSDNDIKIRRACLLLVNALYIKRTQLMSTHISTIMSAVYKESKYRQDLIRFVEMGPFKHQVDDGIDLRKAAYECMYTIIEKSIDKVDITELITNLEDGLKDPCCDIKLQTGMILCRLCVLAPQQILQVIPQLSVQLKSLLQVKDKQNAVRQEIEKTVEMKKSIIRVVKAMETIQDADQLLADIINYIRSHKELSVIDHKMCNESWELEGETNK